MENHKQYQDDFKSTDDKQGEFVAHLFSTHIDL